MKIRRQWTFNVLFNVHRYLYCHYITLYASFIASLFSFLHWWGASREAFPNVSNNFLSNFYFKRGIKKKYLNAVTGRQQAIGVASDVMCHAARCSRAKCAIARNTRPAQPHACERFLAL